VVEIITRYKRYAHITAVFAKHDMGFVFDRIGLSKLLPASKDDDSAKGEGTEADHTLSLAERLRMVFEELGPTFVKMGQIMSTRPDLIPREYIDEFRKLQDHVSEVPFEQIKQVVEDELGHPIEESFADFDSEPLAAASIGQVHRCTLKDGRHAVAKVQRPGIEDLIRKDLTILYGIARMANLSSMAEMVDMVKVVQEFERSILRELDFSAEGRLTEEFAKNFEDDPEVHMAEIFWEHSSRRMLTMEYLEGINISDIGAIKKAKADTKRLARKMVEVTIRQVFFDGLFHADPHPGNLMLLPGGVLGIIDFGMSGRFDKYTLAMLRDLTLDVLTQDYVSMAEHLVDHDVVGYDADMRQLRSDLRGLFRDLASMPMAKASEALQGFVVTHKLRIAPDLFFLDKTFGTLDGTVRLLSPNLDIGRIAEAAFSEQAKSKGIESFGKELLVRLYREVDALVELPVLIRRLLRKTDAGHLAVRNQLHVSDQAYRRLNRFALKLLVAFTGFFALVAAWLLRSHLADRPTMLMGVVAAGAALVLLSAVALWRGDGS